MPLPKAQRQRVARERAGLEHNGELTPAGERLAEEIADADYSPYDESDDCGEWGYDPDDGLPA